MDNRRDFLKTLTAALAVAPWTGGAAEAGARSRREAVAAEPGDAPQVDAHLDAAARQVVRGALRDRQRGGFRSVEMQTITADAEAAEIKEASTKTGLKIHSVMNSDHWRYPLSSADLTWCEERQRMETSIRNAALWGAEAVLLVPRWSIPDVVRDAWTRSQQVIRERLLPVAREAKIIIAVEEVWNKFLQSPLEFARYVDDFESPWVKAYFDVGNVVINAYPQDWIRTLGSRIVRIHLKEIDRKSQTFAFKNLGEGISTGRRCGARSQRSAIRGMSRPRSRAATWPI